MSAEQTTRCRVDPNLRGIRRWAGDESVAPVDRCVEYNHVQSRGPEHCMAEERWLYLRERRITYHQCYRALTWRFHSWRSNIMYATSFDLPSVLSSDLTLFSTVTRFRVAQVWTTHTTITGLASGSHGRGTLTAAWDPYATSQVPWAVGADRDPTEAYSCTRAFL